MFKLSGLSVAITHPTLGVIDVSQGLSIDSDLMQIEKENNDKAETRQGTRGASYTADPSTEDQNRIITINYLPNSEAAKIFSEMRDQGITFGIFIKNDSDPKFSLMSDQCVIIEEPSTKVNGKKGFSDYEYKIRATNSIKKLGV